METTYKKNHNLIGFPSHITWPLPSQHSLCHISHVCLTVCADCASTGSDYTEEKHTVRCDKDYSNDLRHTILVWKAAHTSRTAHFKKPALLAHVQLDT